MLMLATEVYVCLCVCKYMWSVRNKSAVQYRWCNSQEAKGQILLYNLTVCISSFVYIGCVKVKVKANLVKMAKEVVAYAKLWHSIQN